MANSAEMKVKATMDNSDLKKRAKESKDALRDFAKVGEDAVSSLGNAFGVNTGKIDQMMSAVRGLGENLSKSGNAGTAAFGNLLKGVNGLSAGIAGLGIGAAVAGFKMLKDEAENFKNTVAGANIELATTAYIDTYRQVLHDFNAETGKNVAETEASWKKSWAALKANLKYAFASGEISIFDAITGVGAISSIIGSGNNPAVAAAIEAATEAEKIANRIYETQRKISDASVEWASMERDIAEYKRIGYDRTVDTKTQEEALAKATELIKKRYGEEAELRKTLADLQFEYNNLAESSVADIDKANQLRIQEKDIQERMAIVLKEISERQATVTANAQKEAQARMESLEAYEKMALSRADLQAWSDQAVMTTSIALPTQAVAMETPGLSIPVKPELDTSAVIDISNELQSILTSSFEDISTSLGGLIGDLATGGDAWANFGQSALSSLGDLAISFGKICVASGLASEGIKASLALHPVLALTAGAALIALGTAVKSSLSNIASGNYSAAGSVARSTGSYGSSIGTSFDTRDITVNVKGSLRADGNQLLAVIENENTRRNHTT